MDLVIDYPPHVLLVVQEQNAHMECLVGEGMDHVHSACRHMIVVSQAL